MNYLKYFSLTISTGISSPGLEFLGLKLDPEKNNVRGKETIISTDDSPNKILLIPTNEELVIALDTARLVREYENAAAASDDEQ